MKAISLWQPWATAVAIGAKQNETRHWWTPYRGRLAIHAAKLNTPELREFFSWNVCDPLREAGYSRFEELPFGAIIATCRLVECLHTTDVDCLSAQERSFGDYSPGRYAWVFADIEPLEKPVYCRGYQSFFERRALVATLAECDDNRSIRLNVAAGGTVRNGDVRRRRAPKLARV